MASERKANWKGMNWLRQNKRLAIYLRDGLSCVYCGAAVENGAQLSIDHLTPHSKGGSNGADNLVTCCSRCNSARGNRSVRAFCRATAGYLNHGVQASEIERHVRRQARRSLRVHLAEAKTLIERRGSAARVLASM
jgi:CRISPR/Cas system Type II protein with McrA/HNH and RuvC-like nuclease domain